MKLSDEQIKSIMQKEGSSKTILVDSSEQESVIKDHEKQGWKLYRSSQVSSNKVKMTFTK